MKKISILIPGDQQITQMLKQARSIGVTDAEFLQSVQSQGVPTNQIQKLQNANRLLEFKINALKNHNDYFRDRFVKEQITYYNQFNTNGA
jgi:predicted xylose isomerase-like sugar epimerase